jgi:hypothetical protein
LFVEILRRTLAFAARADGAGEREITGGPYVATRWLDGDGSLAPPPRVTQPSAAEAFALARPSPVSEPGQSEGDFVSGAIVAFQREVSVTQLALPEVMALV